MPSLAWLPNEAREGFVMIAVATPRRRNKNDFCAVAEPFVQGDGLPFSDALNAEWIQRVFREANALFGQDDIFSTQIVPGRRTEVITVVTTLTDPETYSAEDIAVLYGFRWNVELDIRAIKQTLGLDHVRCKTPQMVRRELWVTLLAYNLIRKVIVTSAAIHGKQPRRLGFTLACQTILASWMLLSTGSCSNSRAMYTTMLAHIAGNEVANRPGRIEPRVLKRRRHRYPLMQRPRDQLRLELGQT